MHPDLSKLAEVAVEIPSTLTEGHKPSAKHFLASAPDDAPAAALYTAVRALYGIAILLWEPETLWKTLEKDEVDLDTENRNKLMSAIALQLNPAFYWDSLVFQTTTQALNDVVFSPDSLQENNPAHMSWSVYEASIIRGMDPDGNVVPDFDEDVMTYVSVCLRRAGYAVPPKNLMFADEALELRNPSEFKGFAKQVREAWDKLDKEDLQEQKFSEDPLDVQLANLSSCYVYTADRAKLLGEMIIQVQGS